jgi:hypothetical protein
MIQRKRNRTGLRSSAEMIRAGAPWWLHAVLFGLSLLVTGAAVTILACLTL